MNKTVTYEELLKMKKPPVVSEEAKERFTLFTDRLKEAVQEQINRKDDGHIVIFADYDCDGIFSALTMKEGIRQMASANDVKIDVVISDRFNDGYGIRKDAKDMVQKGDTVLVLDMGSGKDDAYVLQEVMNTTKRYPFVIDHHEMSAIMTGYGNQKGYPKDHLINFYDKSDKGNEPGWCTAGLSYHVFLELTKDMELPEKVNNTVRAYAAIATIADMVPVNSGRDDNATIIMDGLNVISNITVSKDKTLNINDTLAYLLYEKDMLERPHTTTKDMAFNVIPVINAMSRLVENGGQEAYNILSAPLEVDKVEMMIKNNEDRKQIVSDVVNSEDFTTYIKNVRAEQEKNPNMPPIAVYMATDVPRGIVGLVAQEMTRQLNIPSICLTTLPDGSITGSGRNVKSYPDALSIVQEAMIPGTSCGGHENAFGVNIKDFDTLTPYLSSLYQVYTGVTRKETDKVILDLDGVTIDKLYALEPFSVDFPQPTVSMEGVFDNARVLKGQWFSGEMNGFKVFGRNPAEEIEATERYQVEGSLDINFYRGAGRRKATECLQVSMDEISKTLAKEEHEVEAETEEEVER